MLLYFLGLFGNWLCCWLLDKLASSIISVEVNGNAPNERKATGGNLVQSASHHFFLSWIIRALKSCSWDVQMVMGETKEKITLHQLALGTYKQPFCHIPFSLPLLT
jgi:hypothetical protein